MEYVVDGSFEEFDCSAYKQGDETVTKNTGIFRDILEYLWMMSLLAKYNSSLLITWPNHTHFVWFYFDKFCYS